MDNNKVRYCDKRAIELIDLIDEFEPDTPSFKEPIGSTGERGYLDLRDKIVDSPSIISDTSIIDEKLNIRRQYKGSCFGFNNKSYNEFVKLVKVFHKGCPYTDTVSFEFLHKHAFNWFTDVYLNKVIKSSFCNYLIDACSSSIKSYIIEFPVLYLDVDKDFKIGNCEVFYYDKKEINEKIEKFQGEDKDGYEKFLKDRLLGQVFVRYRVSAESKKAKEIAFKKCSVAIDVLRICSKTLIVPEYKLSFDIDARVNETIMSELILKIEDQPDELILSKTARPNMYRVNDKNWKESLHLEINVFSRFLLGYTENENEVRDLVFLSIKMFSRCLSVENLPSRIVNLFSILEMLLVKNSTAPILDGLCTYGSKIIFERIEDRKHLISLFKKMYAIRSAKVHHAKDKHVDSHDLKQLQLSLHMLLLTLIRMSNKFDKKAKILESIDDRIMRA